MTVRYKYKLPSWEKGREIANKIANEYGLSLEEREETIVIYDDEEKIFISFFLDPREFTFVKAKIADEKKEWFEKNLEPLLKI